MEVFFLGRCTAEVVDATAFRSPEGKASCDPVGLNPCERVTGLLTSGRLEVVDIAMFGSRSTTVARTFEKGCVREIERGSFVSGR
jgi:hypothetical protein